MTTKSNIAHVLKVSRAAVTRWSRRGMPTDDVAAAVEWHRSNIRTRVRRAPPAAVAAPSLPADAPAGPATRTWRDRLDKANCEMREAELARLRGDYLPKATVLEVWQRRISTAKQRLLAVPHRVGTQTTANTPRDKVLSLVEDEIYSALVELAGNGATHGD